MYCTNSNKKSTLIMEFMLCLALLSVPWERLERTSMSGRYRPSISITEGCMSNQYISVFIKLAGFVKEKKKNIYIFIPP